MTANFLCVFLSATDIHRRIAKSKIRLKHRNSLIYTKRKNMEYNFAVNLGVPAHFVKKTPPVHLLVLKLGKLVRYKKGEHVMIP